jgi:glycosyltransferase involved in cell wall biosynthesis
MKICFVAGTLGKGGAEQQLYYYLRTLKELGADVTLLCLTRDEFWEEPIRALGVPVTVVGESPSRATRTFRITAEVRRIRPDIVQSQHFYTNLYAMAAAKASGAIDVGAMRNDCISEVADSGRVLGTLSFRLPRYLIGNSRKGIENALSMGRAPSRTFFLQNVVDTDRFSPRAEPRRHGPVRILLAGRLEPQKRVDRFLRLVRSLTGAVDTPVEGVVAGDGALRPEMERLAHEMGLVPATVKFLGRVDDMTPVYRDADLLVLTSDHEGAPNVVMEAMACGIPVVSTDAGDAHAIIGSGQGGFCARSEADLAAQVVSLVTDQRLRDAMGSQARQTALRSFSVAGLGGSLQNIYRRINA